MNSQIKFKVTHADGKSQKVAAELASKRLRLGATLLGLDTPFWVEVTDRRVRMGSDSMNARFNLRGQSRSWSDLAVGDVIEWEGMKIEILLLPEFSKAVDSDTTRFFSAADLEEKAEEKAAPKASSDSDLTSMIFRMNVPKKMIEPSEIQNRIAAYREAEGESLFGPGKISTRTDTTMLAREFTVKIPAFWKHLVLIKDRRVQVSLAVAVVATLTGYFVTRNSRVSEAVAIAPQAPVAPMVQAFQPPQTPLVIAPQAAPAASTNDVAAAAPEMTKEADAPGEFDSMAKEEYFSAVKSGDLGLVKSLVEKRLVDVNFSLDQGRSALHVAAVKGHVEIAKYLLKKKANINAQDASGTTPLMWAVFKRQLKMVEFLAKKKADTSLRREGGDRAIDLAKRYGLKAYVAFLKVPKDKSRAIASSEKSKKGKHSKKKHKEVHSAVE